MIRKCKTRKKADDSIHYPARITCLSHIKTISTIIQNLGKKQLDVIKDSCLGHLLDMPHLRFCGTIMHSLLLREVHNCNGSEEHGMNFHIGGQVIRFSEKEFALMTGLSFGGNPNIEYKYINSTRLIDRYFRGRKEITLTSLESAFLDCQGNSDKVKLALVLLVERVLLGKAKKVNMNLKFLQLVENMEEFNRYPWGLVSYNRTMSSFSDALKDRANKYIKKKQANPDYGCEAYSLSGFPHAFQVWAFERIPMLALKFAKRVKCSKDHPILQWTCQNKASFSEIEHAFESDELKVLPLVVDEKQQRYLKDLLPEDEEDKDNEDMDKEEEENSYENDNGVANDKAGNEEPFTGGDVEYNGAAIDASALKAILTIFSWKASNLKEVIEELNVKGVREVRQELNESRQEHLKGPGLRQDHLKWLNEVNQETKGLSGKGFREVTQELNELRQEHLKGLHELRQDQLKGFNEVKWELKGLGGKVDLFLTSLFLEFRAGFQNMTSKIKEVVEEPNEIMQELRRIREMRRELGEFRQEHLSSFSEVRQDHLEGLNIVRQNLKGLSDEINTCLSSFIPDIRCEFENMEPNKIRQDVNGLREVKPELSELRQEHLKGLTEVRQDYLKVLNEVRQELEGMSDEMDDYLTSFMLETGTEFQNMTKRQRKQ